MLDTLLEQKTICNKQNKASNAHKHNMYVNQS